MTPTTLLAMSACLCAGLAWANPQDPESPPAVLADSPPNVIVLLVDDVGLTDLGAFGGSGGITPHLDRLAREAVRCTRAYSCSPVCAPARAGLLTGRHPQRFGYVMTTGGHARQAQQDRGLPVSESLLVEPFRAAGYRTAAIGKWHLGVNDKYHPQRRGFDEFFGFLGGVHDYFEWQSDVEGSVLRGAEVATGDAYLTDAFTDEAVAFIERNAARPFFLYLAYSAVHLPQQAWRDVLERFDEVPPERRMRAAMLGALDDGVGRIMARLAELALDGRTLLVFASDNGGDVENGELRAGKGKVYEGGVRVPMFVRWPGRLEPRDEPGMISLLDVMPTALAACGLPVGDRPLDGIDLLPLLGGTADARAHDVLYWRFGAYNAILAGSHKLHLFGPFTELYDLATDPGEAHDLAASDPQRVAELRQRLGAWQEQMPQPLWDMK